MGAAAAFIMPATLSILTNTFTDARERAAATGIWSGVIGIGVVLGPLAGGFLLDHFWWGSVFVVNVPIAAVAIVAGRFLVPESRDPDAPRVDWTGGALSVIGLVALVTAIIEAPTRSSIARNARRRLMGLCRRSGDCSRAKGADSRSAVCSAWCSAGPSRGS
jgi:MFS family permease